MKQFSFHLSHFTSLASRGFTGLHGSFYALNTLTTVKKFALFMLLFSQFAFLGTVGAQATTNPGDESGGDEGGGNPTATIVVKCDKVCVIFNGDPGMSHYFYPYPGGPRLQMTSVVAGPGIEFCFPNDVNLGNIQWYHSNSIFPASFKPYDYPNSNIFIGNGCGSSRKISDLVNSGILPSGSLTGKTIYSFGDLEADISYTFNNCIMKVLPGSVIRVTAGAHLNLTGGGAYEPHLVAGCDQAMWNGLEASGSGQLTTNGITVDRALFGIRPIRTSDGTPKLNVDGTTFAKNFIGICAASGRYTLNSFSGNTFTGGSIPLEVKFCSGGSLPGGVPYLNWSYAGIYADQSASVPMPLGSAGNNFNNLSAGIVCKGTFAIIRGCVFNNILLQHVGSKLDTKLHGSAIIFETGSEPSQQLLYVNGCTMNICDRGILANVKHQNAFVYIKGNTILSIQKGVDITTTPGASGFYCDVSDNQIDCSRLSNGLRHDNRAYGIEVDNLGIGAIMKIDDNSIKLDIYQSFSVSVDTFNSIYPIGINIVNMAAPSAQTSYCLMRTNEIDVKFGAEAIRLENVINAVVAANNPIALNVPASSFVPAVTGIHAINCSDADVSCNIITGLNFTLTLGIYTESCPNLRLDENNITYTIAGAALSGTHSTSCSVSGNDFIGFPPDPSFPDGRGRGLVYLDALTGPQNKTGNIWSGDYRDGAYCLYNDNSYCLSQYTVTSASNVGAFNPLNPVTIIGALDPTCMGWFSYTTGSESGPGCSGTTNERSSAGANQADLMLTADNFSQIGAEGWKWAAEAAVYRKFAEHPEGMSEATPVQHFMQHRASGPVGKMYAVRKMLADIQETGMDNDPLARLTAVESALEEGTETALWAALPQLPSEAETAAVAAAVTNLKTANEAIECSGQPCLNEQWLYGLYTRVVLEKGAAMSVAESAQLRALALTCASDGGPAVYLARSWHYIYTGERLAAPCSNPLPEVEERNNKQNTAIQSLSVSPNPANTEITLRISADATATQVQITDLTGRIAHQLSVTPGDGTVTISTTYIPPGLYQLRLLNDFGKTTAATKVVIVH